MAKQRLAEIRKIRLEKQAKLKELGIDPYPAKLKFVPEPIGVARQNLGKEVAVAGRFMARREHGNIIFGDLRGETGQIQLFFQKKLLEDQFKILKLLDIGDFLLVSGRVFQTDAGELTINVGEFQLLTKSVQPLPSSWHGLKDVEERYRKRYVDLILNPEVRKVFEKRAKIISSLRDYLDKNGFIEVRTPVLQPLYGGASAKPFTTHHNALDHDFYLRISDELYLKRLVVGGFHKVYELGTDFRNEGIDRWHNPEFQMLEFYWAYADYEDLMRMTEEMLTGTVKAIVGGKRVKYGEKDINWATPWKRISFTDALREYANLSDISERDPEELDGIYKEKVRPNLINPTFLVDHPRTMRPLAKKKNDNQVESFQLVVAGAELINAYSELNDPMDQRERWDEEMKRGNSGSEEYQVIDEDYIRALEYGMPPTAGWGLGIDRFTAILTNQHSIKDTILFPTLRPERSINKRIKNLREE